MQIAMLKVALLAELEAPTMGRQSGLGIGSE